MRRRTSQTVSWRPPRCFRTEPDRRVWLLLRATMACRNPIVERLRHPSKIFPVAMRLRCGSIQQTRIGKILDGDVAFRVSDSQLPAVDIALTCLGLDGFPVEFEPSAHRARLYRRAVRDCHVTSQRSHRV